MYIQDKYIYFYNVVNIFLINNRIETSICSYQSVYGLNRCYAPTVATIALHLSITTLDINCFLCRPYTILFITLFSVEVWMIFKPFSSGVECYLHPCTATVDTVRDLMTISCTTLEASVLPLALLHLFYYIGVFWDGIVCACVCVLQSRFLMF